MPRLNNQGPEGKGPLSGRQRGLCNQDAQNPATEGTANTEQQDMAQVTPKGGAGCRRRGGSGRGLGMGGGRRQR